MPHIINNAFGVQSREIMKLVRGAVDAGRVDAIVQSTDKNFLTPVGGAIVASPNDEFLDAVSEVYAGRATAAPIAQFLAAVLSVGLEGYEKLRNQQEENRGSLNHRKGSCGEAWAANTGCLQPNLGGGDAGWQRRQENRSSLVRGKGQWCKSAGKK